MFDALPFPRITEKTPEGQIGELISYISQLKETLEFILMNIGEDNLSPELVEKLNSLGADVEKSGGYREDELAQVSNNSITMSDVINTVSGITFSVNYENGKLEYFVP